MNFRRLIRSPGWPAQASVSRRLSSAEPETRKRQADGRLAQKRKCSVRTNNVRSSPDSGHSTVWRECPLSADRRHRTLLLDHLVGAGQQCPRHGNSDFFSRLRVDNKFKLGGLLDWKV